MLYTSVSSELHIAAAAEKSESSLDRETLMYDFKNWDLKYTKIIKMLTVFQENDLKSGHG